MKTKRINRITSLVLALVMLASMIALPVYAEENEEGKIFANVDFEKVTVNQVEVPPTEEGGEPTFTTGTSIDPASAGLAGAHTYVSIGEDENGKHAIVPFRGEAIDSKNGSGNYDKTFTVQHPEISYADTQGVSIELDLFIDYAATGVEGAADPTVEFQFKSITHEPDLNGKTSTAWISFGWINLRTGEFSTSAAKLGAKGLKVGDWNKLRFDLDLANATFDIFVNDVKYATYGTIGNGNTPRNIVVPASNLLIAKCNKNKGAYVNDPAVADTDMSHVKVDNIKFYENTDFVPPLPEPVVPYSIYNDSLQSKPVGLSPKFSGYPYAPSTAIVTNDIVDSSNQVVKVDLIGKGACEYYLVPSTNNGARGFEEGQYTIEEVEQADGSKVLMFNGTSTKGDTISVPASFIWGDDPSERSGNPGETYIIASMADVKDGASKACSWYLTTGEYADARHGAGNVATGLQPKHPKILSANYDTVVLNVDYYFSEDAIGKMEVQMQGSFALKSDNNVSTSKTWIDIACFELKADSDIIQFASLSNYELVCGSAPTVRKGEWFTLSAVFDMHTGYEDIYINGSYCFTYKPRATYTIGGQEVSENDFEFIFIDSNTLNVGKIQRNRVPASLAGFYMIDNINFSTGESLLGERYEKNFVQNFDDIAPDTVDFSATMFGDSIPASVVLASEGTHTSALKMNIGERMDEEIANAPVVFRTSSNADETMYRVAKVYDNGYIVLVKDLPAGVTEAPETAPDYAIKPNAKKQYKVGETSGFSLGTYLEYVNFWGKDDQGNPTGNVDKQWTFHNPGISYATKSRVATDFEIYIPEGASGLVTSQIKKGAGTDSNGRKANFSFMNLYTLDLANGQISLGGSATINKDGDSMGQLNVGEWNTVSIAINMITGVAELYVNNFFVGEDDIGMTQLAFYENTWILAKVARKQDPKDHPLAGYILIDDARFFTVTNQLITVDSNLENVTEVRFNGEIVPDGTKLFITEDVPYEPVKFDTSDYIDMIEEAYTYDYMVSVRSNAPIGLRFTSYVDQGLLEELLEEYEGTVTFGTVIVPSSAVATMDEITRPELNLRGIEYLEIRTQSFYSNDYLEEDYGIDFEGVFAGSIIGLKEENLSRDFSAVGYVEIALEGGGSIVLYTEEMQANLKSLATAYLDEIDDIPDDIRWVLEGFAIGRYPAGYEKDYTDPNADAGEEVVPPVEEGEVVA